MFTSISSETITTLSNANTVILFWTLVVVWIVLIAIGVVEISNDIVMAVKYIAKKIRNHRKEDMADGNEDSEH